MLLGNFLEKTKNFIAKYASFFCIVTIALFCYLFIFLNLKSSGFIAICNTIMIFALYFFGKKATGSRVYGLISSLVLLSSALICVFLRLALADTIFVSFATLSILSAGITLFNIKEENKKYFWYLFYLFTGLCVLGQGSSGPILPIMSVVLSFAALNRLKDIIKPVNIIPGLIIYFIAIFATPAILNKTGTVLSVNNFINLSEIAIPNFVPVILAGFLPWIFSFVSAAIRGIKSLIKDYKATKSIRQIFSNDTNDRKLLIFASVYMFAAIIFYIVSGLNFISLMLPVLPALALITGYYWWGYISDNKFEKGIKNSTIIGIISLIIISLAAFFAPQIQNIETIKSTASCWAIVMSLIAILCLISKNRPLLFVSNVVLMLGISLIIAFA